LANVVRHFQGGLFIHDDVDFDVVFLTSVVGTARVNLADLLVVSNRQVDDLGNELLGSSFSYEEPYLVESCRYPGEKDQ
jgi:hypothetical protein